MAQFPTSAKTFTARSNGQAIDASHVGDLQDEVAAIEDGLLNGTARLNSSNSTVTNLSVLGGSTVAGALSVSGASSLASLHVTGASTFVVRPSMPSPSDVVILTGSTSQFANGASGGVSWPTETTLLNSSMHSTGSNPDRVVPQSSGTYAIDVAVSLAGAFADPSTGTMDLIIKDSSGGTVWFTRVTGTAGGRAPSIWATAKRRFDSIAAAPYLRVAFIQRGNSTNSLDGTKSFLSFTKL